MAKHTYSIVDYYAEQGGLKCGYCNSPNTSFSHGMWAYSLTVEDYQNLIDRGWRRSGCYCYKPTMDQTCCPMYTIKCEALHFKISKSQKKILKRMVKFLKNELKKDDIMDTNEEDQRDNIEINTEDIPNYDKHLLKAQQNASKMNVSSIDHELNGRLQFSESNERKKNCDDVKHQQKDSESITSLSNQNEDSHVASQAMQAVETTSARTPCKKAKLLRMERKQNKLLAQGKTQEEVEAIFKENKQQNQAKSLEELFDEVYNGTSKLEMKLVRVMSDKFLSTVDASANLYRKYQMAIHNDPPEKCDRKSFYNFLVRSPLQEWTSDDGPPKGYGSFHEQYWLDNELIAVGVIDILPQCVSSVYFFYDPAYSHLSLGTFSSLREVYLTRQLNKIAKDLKYYYMGFYIHTCPKMRYKAKMKPSMLLCPETYMWFNIDPCLAKLDKAKYSRLNNDIDAIDEDGIVDIRKILVLFRGATMPWNVYKVRAQQGITKEEEDQLKIYATLVGMKCAQSLLLFRSEIESLLTEQ